MMNDGVYARYDTCKRCGATGGQVEGDLCIVAEDCKPKPDVFDRLSETGRREGYLLAADVFDRLAGQGMEVTGPGHVDETNA